MDVLARDFTAYGTSHLGAVLVLATGIVALLALGRMADPRDRLGKALAVVLAAAVVPLQTVYVTPGYWDRSARSRSSCATSQRSPRSSPC